MAEATSNPSTPHFESQEQTNDAFRQLQYKDQARLLDAMDELTLQGVRKYVSLPRIIVCGDQSSGKSSVLEAISHVQFPVKGGLCTTFPTELVIRRTNSQEPTVTIVPGPLRSSEAKERLRQFSSVHNDPTDLPNIIAAARQAIENCEPSHSQQIFDDKLRIQICKSNWPPLTIVDLPGLIQNKQFGDVVHVKQLVKSHMEDPRSIILAIISASNDLANQVVLDLVKDVDPAGVRTLGVITKPDTLPPIGSEVMKTFIRLARNEPGDFHFEHGWHVLKNRGYAEASQTAQERDASEKRFFDQQPWLSLPRRVGIEALRSRLSRMLHEQIVLSLPDVMQEINAGIAHAEAGLKRLGPSRASQQEKRKFLAGIAESFQRIAQSAVDGTWSSSFFGDPFSTEGYNRRLRAVVQNLNEEFASVMSERSHQWQLCDVKDTVFGTPKTPVPKRYSSFEAPTISHKKAALEKIETLSRVTRGRELPGVFNHHAIGALFREQSNRWKRYAECHIDGVCEAINIFLEQAFGKLTEGQTYSAVSFNIVRPFMEQKRHAAKAKLDEIIAPFSRQHPISYNSNLVKSVKSARASRQKQEIHDQLRASATDRRVHADIESLEQKLMEALDPSATRSEDAFACSEILDHVEAYYQVALNNFVDNVASLVIESCLIEDLPTIFPADSIHGIDDDTLDRLASESEDTQAERQSLNRMKDSLEGGLKICGEHSIHIHHGSHATRLSGTSVTSAVAWSAHNADQNLAQSIGDALSPDSIRLAQRSRSNVRRSPSPMTNRNGQQPSSISSHASNSSSFGQSGLSQTTFGLALNSSDGQQRPSISLFGQSTTRSGASKGKSPVVNLPSSSQSASSNANSSLLQSSN